ncbi:putative cytoplasmic protein [Legionella pneumophila subsp. pneumophila LPE509]|nr:putative cytoplasmic protein [Legionella pneumophila subsp. pneumophila LPE509]
MVMHRLRPSLALSYNNGNLNFYRCTLGKNGLLGLFKNNIVFYKQI